MKWKETWEGVPGFYVDDPQSPDGRRWIATHWGWGIVQERVKELAHNRCELNLAIDCAGVTRYLDTHHRRGRGAGGAKRDDRIVILGKRNLLAACRSCHDLAKIERKEEIWPTVRKSEPETTSQPADI